MVQLGLCIKNEHGETATVGDVIKPTLEVYNWVSKNQYVTITDISVDGTLMLDGYICQHISGIIDFKKK